MGFDHTAILNKTRASFCALAKQFVSLAVEHVGVDTTDCWRFTAGTDEKRPERHKPAIAG
jgi:hypothetical protein